MRALVLGLKGAREGAERLGSLLRVPVELAEGDLKARFEKAWGGHDALVFVGAVPIAIRAMAHLLSDKASDPAVLALPEDLSWVMVLAGGHLGGGSDLAWEIASRTGARWIPSTATDRRLITAPDRWARRHDLRLLNKRLLPGLIRGLLDRGELRWWCDPLLPHPPLPHGAVEAGTPEEAQVLYTVRDLGLEDRLVLVPRAISVGVGFRRDAAGEEIRSGVLDALRSHPEGPFLPEALRRLGTWEGKEGSRSLMEAAGSLGAEVRFFRQGEILGAEGPFSPSAAERHLGLPGVSEPCAALMGRPLGGRMVLGGITAALALEDPPFAGSLSVVGIGPGDPRLMTVEALEELEGCDVIVGYSLYVDLVPSHIRGAKRLESYRMGQEEDRVVRAVELAEAGYRVALVCGGDPVLFGLGALAQRHAEGRVSFRIVPGLSAAQGAARAVGPYYTNGLSLLSLSDYLQDWDRVREALESAAGGGLSAGIYNPVSRGREEKLEAVRRAFRGRRALVCTDISRPGEEVREVAVEELTKDLVTMRSMIIVPGRGCERTPQGQWRDLRGYSSEGSHREMPELDVLVAGGTSDGYEAARELLELGLRVGVSVAYGTGLSVVPPGAAALVGPLDRMGWEDRLRELSRRGLRAVLDATHPFASEVKGHLDGACGALSIPLVRLSRPIRIPTEAVRVGSYGEMTEALISRTGPGDLVFLTFGVKGLVEVAGPLKGAGRRVLARVLPTEDSLRGALSAGLSGREILCSWGSLGAVSDRAIMEDAGARACAAKASGDPSGLEGKRRACMEMGIPLVLLVPPRFEGLEMAEALERVRSMLGR